MGEPIGEEAEAQLERRLRDAAPTADPGFRRQLRAQLLQELKPEERTLIAHNRRKLWRLAGTALALALLLLLLLTPAGEVLADLLTVGWYRLTDNPTRTEELIAEPVDDATTVTLPTRRFASAAAASEEAGFTVLAPTHVPEGYLPQEGARPLALVFGTDGSVRKATADYVSSEGDYLSYEQIPYDPELADTPYDLGTGDAEPQPVTINGAEGVFFEGIVWGMRPGDDGEPVPVRYNVLLWQEEVEGQPFMFWLHSSERLPLAELVRVAESVSAEWDGVGESR